MVYYMTKGLALLGGMREPQHLIFSQTTKLIPSIRLPVLNIQLTTLAVFKTEYGKIYYEINAYGSKATSHPPSKSSYWTL